MYRRSAIMLDAQLLLRVHVACIRRLETATKNSVTPGGKYLKTNLQNVSSLSLSLCEIHLHPVIKFSSISFSVFVST